MLDNIRQRIAQLRVEAVATDKLTQSQKDLLAFDQKVTDLRSKRKKLSDDDKSLLRDQQAIRGMYEQAAQLEKEVRYRDAINKLKERSAQIDAELGDYAAERQRDVQRELAAMSMGDNARELNQSVNRVGDEFRRRRDELTKGARKDGTLGSPEYLAEIERINAAEAEQVARERGYVEQRLALQADWRVGVKRALAVYQESAQNAAQMAEEALTSSFRNAEDALVSFATSGKLNFRGLVDSMIADLARFSARAAMSQVFGAIGSALGFGGVSDAVGALGGAASAAVGSNAYGFHLATGGSVWGPGTSTSDSIPAQLSNGEFVVRAAVVSQPGVRAHLERLNAGGRSGFARFAAGGLVGGNAGRGELSTRDGGISVSAPVTIEGGSASPASLIAVGEFRRMLEQVIRELILRELRQGGSLWRANQGLAK